MAIRGRRILILLKNWHLERITGFIESHILGLAIIQAVKALLDLGETWENTTQEDHKDLVQVIIQEMGIDMAAKSMLWVRANQDYEPLFSFLEGLCIDAKMSDRRFSAKNLTSTA